MTAESTEPVAEGAATGEKKRGGWGGARPGSGPKPRSHHKKPEGSTHAHDQPRAEGEEQPKRAYKRREPEKPKGYKLTGAELKQLMMVGLGTGVAGAKKRGYLVTPNPEVTALWLEAGEKTGDYYDIEINPLWVLAIASVAMVGFMDVKKDPDFKPKGKSNAPKSGPDEQHPGGGPTAPQVAGPSPDDSGGGAAGPGQNDAAT